MQIISRLREERRNMACRALRRAVEQHLAPLERSLVVGSCWRGRGRDRELVEVKRRKLRRYSVGRAAGVSGAALCGNRVLILVIETSIEERPGAVHLANPDIGVPVGDRSESGPGMQIHTGKAEGRRDQRTGLLAIGTKGFAILVQFSIEAARPPTGENLLNRVDIDAKQVSERLEVGRKRHDRTDIEIAVSPTIKPLTDSGCERVVYSRVA